MQNAEFKMQTLREARNRSIEDRPQATSAAAVGYRLNSAF